MQEQIEQLEQKTLEKENCEQMCIASVTVFCQLCVIGRTLEKLPRTAPKRVNLKLIETHA